jgi:DNA transposition AAA+ family ATPase
MVATSAFVIEIDPTRYALVQIADPTTSVLTDEADRLRLAALEQVRDIFDHGGIEVVFIGMPGIERCLSRYPQLCSRVGFVQAFRPLSAAEAHGLLQRQWVPAGAVLLEDGWADEETRAAIIRITGETSGCSTGSSPSNCTPHRY